MKISKKYLGIEMLRFLCAISVVFWHYQHFYTGEGNVFVVPFIRESQPLYWIFSPFYRWGHMSVSIFWMISGFIFFWKYHDAIRSGDVRGYDFFILRFSRLYPLHILTWTVVAALQIIFSHQHDGAHFVYSNDDFMHFFLGIFFATSWGFENGLSFNGPIWSVSVEVLVYAVFFMISTQVRANLLGRVILVGVALGLWLLNERHGSAAVRVIFTCSVYFFLGGAMHAVVRKVSDGWLRRIVPLAMVGAVLVASFLFRDDVNASKIWILVFSVLLLLIFLGLELWKPFAVFFGWMAPAADMTYSSYLLHFPIQLCMVILTDWLGYSRTLYDRPALLIVFFIVVFSSAWWVHHGFERPMQRWIRRVFLKR